jgi:hypothetical protein
MGPALGNVATPRSIEGDIDGAQPTMGAIDLEADGPALVERAGIRRQIRAMHEHVASNQVCLDSIAPARY